VTNLYTETPPSSSHDTLDTRRRSLPTRHCCAARAGRSRYVGISTNSLCMLCGRWRDRTSGVALRGEASNHLELHWLKTVVVSVKEKAAGSCQVWDREDERE
jgi:hypothetical protein